MRDPNLDILNCHSDFSEDETLEMFRRASLCRNFELYLRDLMDSRNMGMPIYLSLGQEYLASALSMSFEDCSIFGQHRGHSTYLSFGGDIHKLIDELLMRDSGCCGGMGGSACIADPNIRMYGHSGLLGDQVPIAVGAALGGHPKVLSIAGDAAAEEDYVLGAMGFAVTHKLPVLFVCEDNDRSILTPINVRRSWKITDVAKSFGMKAIDMADDPWTVMSIVRGIESLPYYMNVHVCRKLWHAGPGNDGPPEWDRHELVMEKISSMGLVDRANKIDLETKNYIEKIWKEH